MASNHLPVQTLADLARTRAEEAARKLAALRDANVSAERKLDLLLQYRSDYAQQLQVLLEQGLTATQWLNYQNFLRALDHGLEQQRHAAHQAQARLNVGRGDWQAQRRRLNAFDTLGDRLRRQEALVESRRDQRASDEQAARMALAGRSRA